MLNKLFLILRTVIHLKPVQVYYQVYYRFRNKVKGPLHYANLKGFSSVQETLSLEYFPFVPESSGIQLDQAGDVKFTFLNESKKFATGKIDWNDDGLGKLWTYNLNYFDFLFDEHLNHQEAAQLIDQYIEATNQLKDGLEPYPISLRGINWIKFMAHAKIIRDDWNESLYKQYQVLKANLEYHLLANHLLENGFSLLFGAYHFRNAAFYDQAKWILQEQLEEQILTDGAHYERAPMYHQILLWRVLDCINLVRNNDWQNQELLTLLIDKAGKMLGWLKQITFANGEIPMVKDSTSGIAPSTHTILNYAQRLGVSVCESVLGDSFYRKMYCGPLELLVNIGGVSPSYQPGHAHADELNIILYVNEKPVLVDTGLSTYEKGKLRQHERSTNAHNCVSINGKNSSEVWGGFRVGRRAKVEVLQDEKHLIHARHDGFKREGAIVERKIKVDDELTVENIVHAESGLAEYEMPLHFHPDVNLKLEDNRIRTDELDIILVGVKAMSKEKYMFALGFNRKVEAPMAKLLIQSKSKLIIRNAG